MNALLKPSFVKVERDLNGFVRVQIADGMVAVLRPQQAIEIAGAILNAAGCTLDFKRPHQ